MLPNKNNFHWKDYSSQQGDDLKIIMSDRTVNLNSVDYSEEFKNGEEEEEEEEKEEEGEKGGTEGKRD